ncbi:hypothetical protein H0H87_012875 [Tephrocybe sp. NHM501043]|nr:hypothetical protein H0H87_012875 [Tephrocybe sp. NHM501043]
MNNLAKSTDSVLTSALKKYIDNIPHAKHKKELLYPFYNQNQLISAEDVQNILQRMEHKSEEKERNSPKVSKVFRRVFEALKAYDEVITVFGLQTTISSISPKCTNKLTAIIDKLRVKEENVRYQIQILQQEQRVNWHREDIVLDSTNLTTFRTPEKEIIAWLRDQAVTSACHSRRDQLQRGQSLGTFLWTKQHPQISPWLDRQESGVFIIPLYAPPGWGKSTLCAHAIKSILDTDSSSPVLYHFCRFDQPFVAGDILRHFASQLFHTLLASHLCSYDVVQKIKNIVNEENTFHRLRAERIIRELVKLSSPVWIFLDGLDEEVEPYRWAEILPVLDFLLGLSKTNSTVRLWSSSQNVGPVQNMFKDYAPIDVESDMRPDVEDFLTKKAVELDLSERDHELLITRIKMDGFSGGFLWANMLIDALRMAKNGDDKFCIIIRGPSLDDYYGQFFKRKDHSEKSKDE